MIMDQLTSSSVLYLSESASTKEVMSILEKAISKSDEYLSAPLYNMASVASESGFTDTATEYFKRFLSIESHGLFAQNARRFLNLPAEDIPQEAASPVSMPIPTGEINESTRQVLDKMKKKEIEIENFSGELYEDSLLKVLVSYDSVEIVDKLLKEPMDLPALKKQSGEPVRVIKHHEGMTLIYHRFGVDVTDGKVKKIFCFLADL